MNVLTRMYRGETHFDFVGTARKTLLVSAVSNVWHPMGVWRP